MVALAGMFLLSWTPSEAFTGRPQSHTSGDLIRSLVERAQMPMAAISPSGTRIAYAVVRGDVGRNDYKVTIWLSDLRAGGKSQTVASYALAPGDAYSPLHWLRDGAAELYWLSDNQLLMVSHEAGAARLLLWDVARSKAIKIGEPHSGIVFDIPADYARSDLKVAIEDVIDPPQSSTPEDKSWRMEDSYIFRSQFRNPKTGTWVRRAVVSPTVVEDTIALGPEASVTSGWKIDVPKVDSTLPGRNGRVYILDKTPSPNGEMSAYIENRFVNDDRPEPIYQAYRLVVSKGDQQRVLVPDTAPYVYVSTTLLAWLPASDSLSYLHAGPQTTELRQVSLSGRIRRQWTSSDAFVRPCSPLRRCQTVSRNGRYALLVQSSNLNPGRLVRLDLNTGERITIADPNKDFVGSKATVRFLSVPQEGGKVWGRLYLPPDFKNRKPLPLVISQYVSSPGFGTDVGEEVPFSALINRGIAVLDLNFNSTAHGGVDGRLQLEVSRLDRPLKAMRYLVADLAKEGLVDPTKVGIAGISYAAETAMYAYWNWPGLRAVSVSTPSWHPNLYFMGGVNFTHHFADRGLHEPIGEGEKSWLRISAPLHAGRDSPPLLIQSGDGEENMVQPSWSNLRTKGAEVEWIEYPEEGHVKIYPATKWWVYNRNVDWFSFWLLGRPDEDPDKGAQYQRWNSMRRARSDD